jgi:hypothetical protein
MSSNTLLFLFPSCIVIVNKIITSSLHLIDSKYIFPRFIEFRYHQGFLEPATRTIKTRTSRSCRLLALAYLHKRDFFGRQPQVVFLSEQLRSHIIVNDNLQPVIQG